MLTKKVINVGFDAVRTVEQRPMGIDALAAYPVFPPELVAFLRSALPHERHGAPVHAVTVLARKPAAAAAPQQ